MSRHHLSPLVGEDSEIVEELLLALDHLNYARRAAGPPGQGESQAIIDAGKPIRALIAEYKARNA